MRRNWYLLLALALAAGVLVAGCGGSDDDSDDDGTALTKSEWITQADAICAEGNTAIDDAFSGVGDNPTPDEIGAITTDTVVPEIQSEVDQISDLTPPEGDEDQVDAILTAAQDGVDTLDADPTALATGSADPFAEANKLAKEYGLQECGS